MGQGVQIDGGRELEILSQEFPLAGSFGRRIIEAVNRLAQTIGASATGLLPAPPPVDSTDVSGSYDATTNTMTVNGEVLHAVHTHNVPINRGIQYVTEVADNPNFTNAHPIDIGSSRSVFAHLPANDANNVPIGYYMRTTAQYPGSQPSQPTVFGGLQGPTKILMTGTSRVSLLTSQAGGTARPGQHGQGLGEVLARAAVGGPKRSAK